MKKWNKFTHKILSFILIGVIASTTVSLNYNKIREVKAVAVVDDALVVVAILAMCGVAWTSIEHFWSPGGWINEGDSPVADPDLQKWANGFNERWQKQWDDDVKKKALELGLIDEDGNIKNNGSSSGGGDDNDNKFPSWDELKTLISNNKGKIGASMASLFPFIALFGYKTYEDSKGVKLNKLTTLDTLNKSDIILNDYISENNIDLSVYPYYLKVVQEYGTHYSVQYYYVPNGYYYQANEDYTRFVVHKTSDGDWGKTFEISISKKDNSSSLSKGDIPFSAKDINFSSSSYKYWNTNLPLKDATILDKIITPSSISSSTNLDDYLKKNNNLPDSPFADFSRIPTNDEFKKYLEDLKNTSNDDDKQKIIDDFIKTITTPSEPPMPDPKPDPSNPTPTPNPDTPDNPDSDNDFSVRDLRLVFPFCIPFDLVDCFRLFNSEPETPRVQFPVHFGIVNKDYTFDIDLKDFNDVAVVCRSMFLILYIVGLVLVTRHLIRG